MVGAGRGRRRGDEDPARRRRARRSSAATRAARCTPGATDYVDGSMNPMKRWYAETTNPRAPRRRPGDVIEGTDLFIGVSGARRDAGRGARPHERRSRWSSRWPTRTPRSRPRRPRHACGSWRPGAPTTRTRSTTCSPSPASSAARSTCARAQITEEMKMAAARAIAEVDPGRGAARGLHRPLGVQPRRRAGGRRRRRRDGARPGHRRGGRRGRLRGHRDASDHLAVLEPGPTRPPNRSPRPPRRTRAVTWAGR